MKGILKHCIFPCITFSFAAAFAQQSRIDSLEKALVTVQADTNKINLLNALSFEYRSIDPDRSIRFGKEALILSHKNKFQKGLVLAAIYIASTSINLGEYDVAMGYLKNAFLLARWNSDEKSMALAYNNIGNIYFYQGNYPEALKNFLSALALREQLLEEAKAAKDEARITEFKKAVAASYNNIGNLYTAQKNWADGLKYAFLSLKLKEEVDDKYGMAFSYNNIGLTFHRQSQDNTNPDTVRKKLNDALANYYVSLRIREEIGDKRGIASGYNNIATIYYDRKDYDEALKNYFASLSLAEETGNNMLMGLVHNNIGGANFKLKKFDAAREHLLTGLKISKSVRSTENVRDSYRELAVVDSALGNFKEALEYHKLYVLCRDSLINEDNTRKIVEEQMRYDFDKKEAFSKAEQVKKDVVAEEEKRRQRLLLWLVISVGAAIAVTASVIFRSLRLTRTQKRIIDEKNRHITDSIIYAEHIQSSVLLSEEEVNKELPFESFIFYQPKDIVSGDFYWISSIIDSGNPKYIIAAADCTGHGVPGAFLSMIGAMLLNEVVNAKKIVDPPTILKELHSDIIHALHRENEANHFRDGMNMSVCCIDPGNKTICYAGAGNPVYVVRKAGNESKLEAIKGDAVSLGDKVHGGQRADLAFASHKISLEEGTRIYLFSDGYMDQYQDGSKTRMGSARFKKLLTDSAQLPMHLQKEEVKKTFIDWKGAGKQVDDVLVMGIKI